MKILKILSLIGLASFLSLNGLYYLLEQPHPIFQAIIGLIGLATGILLFIGLKNWIKVIKKEK